MDSIKTGACIRQLRTARGMTQKQLAARLHVSDKAISKWERGNGCPDISLLAALAEVFETDAGCLLAGSLHENGKENGDMKKIRFYVCPHCGNLITAASEAAVNCCGRKLRAALPRKAEPDEMLRVEETDGEWYITASHPMTKEHYISYAAYLTDSSVMIFRQYPEWEMQMTLPMYRGGRLIWYCSQCGLLYQELEPGR